MKRRRRDLATSRRPAKKDRLRPEEERPLRPTERCLYPRLASLGSQSGRPERSLPPRSRHLRPHGRGEGEGAAARRGSGGNRKQVNRGVRLVPRLWRPPFSRTLLPSLKTALLRSSERVGQLTRLCGRPFLGSVREAVYSGAPFLKVIHAQSEDSAFPPGKVLVAWSCQTPCDSMGYWCKHVLIQDRPCYQGTPVTEGLTRLRVQFSIMKQQTPNGLSAIIK